LKVEGGRGKGEEEVPSSRFQAIIRNPQSVFRNPNKGA